MKIMIGIPCGDMVDTDFCQCLSTIAKPGPVSYVFAKSSLIYDARNEIVRMAMEGDYDFILWIDSDMTFDQDLLNRMVKHYEEGRDVVCGLCFTRKFPVKPTMVKELRMTYDDAGIPITEAVPFEDYPEEVFEIKGCGMAATMTSVKALKRIADVYGPPFYPRFGWGEDYTFCWLAKDFGIKMYCDPTIKIGHVGSVVFDETTFRSAK